MTRNMPTLVSAATLSISAGVAPSFAGDFSNGYEGSGEMLRGMVGVERPLRDARPAEMQTFDPAEAARALPLSEEAIVKSMTARGITADGKEVTIEPSGALRDLVRKQLSRGSRGADEKKTDGPRKAAAEESGRGVFGKDDRVEITDADAQEYPFRAIGQVTYVTPKGPNYCSASLIGPRTVLTAAHCLYRHEAGGWAGNIQFAPARTGTSDAPFGIFNAETAYVLDGFIDNYQGTYGSVILWDMAVVILKEPIGDNLGWLGYRHYDDMDGFTTNITGYPADKPTRTMWLASCELAAQYIAIDWFQTDCDTYAGSSGSAVYAIDGEEYNVIGIQAAGWPHPDAESLNTAVRLSESYIAWINNLAE